MSPPIVHLEGKDYALHHLTGRVVSASRRSVTSVSGHGGGAYDGSSAPVHISSTTTTHDEFFVEEADGTEHSLQLVDWDIALREGHELTICWMIDVGRKYGPYVGILNWKTGQLTIDRDSLKELFAPSGKLYLIPIIAAVLVDGILGMIGALPLFLAILGGLMLLNRLLDRQQQNSGTPLRLRGLFSAGIIGILVSTFVPHVGGAAVIGIFLWRVSLWRRTLAAARLAIEAHLRSARPEVAG